MQYFTNTGAAIRVLIFGLVLSFAVTAMMGTMLGTMLGAGSGTAFAGAEPEGIIKQRKALMKDVVLKGLKAMKQMVKDDFIDAEEAAKHMAKIAEVADGFAKRFPKGTESGFKTTAGPKIWVDGLDFEAKLTKFAVDARAATIAASKGDDAFKAAFIKVAKNCKGCHETYRIKKK